MRSYFYTIILGITSILVLFFIFLLNNVNFNNNYVLEKTNIIIDNQNISLYLLNLYGNGCYLYNITDGYFIIKNNGPGINYIIPLVEYINTTSFIFCNQTIYYNITIEECLPIVNPCNITCKPGELCPMIRCIEFPSCSNVTYYINMTYPIIIVKDNVFLYENNVFCYSENCNIIYQKLPGNYLYNLIYNLISSIPKNMV
ncbi:MAG: hypothetical protein RXN79_02675 [Candidatus Nanopusillus sp.]